jgi:hypothetical protein
MIYRWIPLIGVTLLAGCTPSTLSQAILKQEDQFPTPQYVMLPPGASSKLGMRPAAALGGDRRTTVEATSCFFVAPTTAESLGELDVTYSSSAELKAEMGAAAASAGVDVKSDDKATLVLSKLLIRSGLGVPNGNGPCGSFDATTTLTVVTSEVVASSVSFDLGRNLAVTANGRVGMGRAPSPTGSGDLGWSQSTSTKLQGQNIVISGQFARVTATVADAGPYDLGTTPPHETRGFPKGFDGNITIESYSDSEGILTYRASVPLGMSQSPPQGMQTCAAGTSISSKQGDRCYFWLSPGNSAVAVWWERASDRITLHVRGYRTDFAK